MRTDEKVSEVLSKDGTRIAYEKQGSGPPVVLVDGAFCFRKSGVTPRLMPLLSKHFTVYAYDRRGRGDSGDRAPYSVAHEIDDLRAVVEAAGGSPYVVGFSSGAALAMQAVAAGVKAKKLAVFEPPYVRNGGAASVPPAAGEEITRLVAAGRRGEAVTYFMTQVFGAPRFFVWLMKMFARDSWAHNESVAHTLPYDIELMGDYAVPAELLRSINVPTVVMSGERAPAALRGAADRVAAAIPNAERRILPRQSHNVSMEVLTPVLVETFRPSLPFP